MLGALLVASVAAVGVSAVGTADRASAAEESDNKPRQIYAGGPAVYLVDHEEGTVQALDPVSLAPRGPLHDLGHKIGRPVVDPEGTLWAPTEETGQVTPVRSEGYGPTVDVANPKNRLWLTLVSGRVTVTDPISQSVAVIGLEGILRRIALPVEISQGNLDQLLIPSWTEGSLVPVLAADSNRLFGIDIDKGRSGGDELGTDRGQLGEPQAVGRTFLVPRFNAARADVDGPTRELLFFKAETLFVRNTIVQEDGDPALVGGKPGPVYVMVRNGRAWLDYIHGAGMLTG